MRHLLDILDLSCEEIDELCRVAYDIVCHPDAYRQSAQHKTLATAFFEPSTRTRLSFTAAMLELGGSVLGFSDANTSSAKKGETVADTLAVLSCYADIVAMRHPNEGAALVGATKSLVPIINAGDGGHHHPTQTLTDLFTIYREIGRFEHLRVGLVGDLKYGRTVHSLIAALSRYAGVHFVLISPPELAIPEYVKEQFLDGSSVTYEERSDLAQALDEGDLDVLYMTRVQQERFASRSEYERLKDVYILDRAKLELAGEKLIVLHPLPRVNEITLEVDDDPRAAYFRQALNGKYIRMALILHLLAIADGESDAFTLAGGVSGKHAVGGLRPTHRLGGLAPQGASAKQVRLSQHCQNVHCITAHPSEQALPADFIELASGVYRCVYCEQVMRSTPHEQ